jgi:hypothetical protein
MADVNQSEQDAMQYLPCHGLVGKTGDHREFDIDPRRDQKELPRECQL